MKHKIGIQSLDHHHDDVFEMIRRLDNAVSANKRHAFEPIITFLEEHTLDHFNEEEKIMKHANFKLLTEHEKEHTTFKRKIKTIRKMYNENIHTTHIAYSIRQFIDLLIDHILTTDVKMKGIHHD